MQPVVIRGGCVYFEPGAVGGLFVGVFFIEDPELDEVSAGEWRKNRDDLDQTACFMSICRCSNQSCGDS
jgi:hypothetical protein